MIKHSKTICVVDDDPSVCKALSRLLKSAGFSVKTYASAQEFLYDDHAEGSDLLVLDVRMPGMNGLDLQNHLAASGHTIPIVFITAHENGITKKKAMASGAVAFLLKPFGEKDLLEAICKGLDRNIA
ncbi:response regulator transcription factor [Thermodesulfobacteriota bacterium]